MIKHLTYPDNFMSEMETTIAQIAGLADDPDMKVVVVNQAIREQLKASAASRKNALTSFASQAKLTKTRTLSRLSQTAINADFVSRGYLIIHTAKELGCDTFVHISFPAT